MQLSCFELLGDQITDLLPVEELDPQDVQYEEMSAAGRAVCTGVLGRSKTTVRYSRNMVQALCTSQ